MCALEAPAQLTADVAVVVDVDSAESKVHVRVVRGTEGDGDQIINLCMESAQIDDLMTPDTLTQANLIIGGLFRPKPS